MCLLNAVATGSRRVSPFLHFSWEFLEARLWHVKGRTNRRESRNLICRVPLAALSQAGNLEAPLQALEYVDLSSPTAAKPHLSRWVGEESVQQLLSSLDHAHAMKEVLVAWRGMVPRHLFEVINDTTGEFVSMLDDEVPLASSHVGGRHCESIAF